MLKTVNSSPEDSQPPDTAIMRMAVDMVPSLERKTVRLRIVSRRYCYNAHGI
jgi:hypothetical protein